MVLHPNATLCSQLVQFFLEGQKSDPKAFNGYNTRDGMIFRKFFYGRYIPMSSIYSAHREGKRSLVGLKMLHFRGGWKPWYNIKWQGKEIAHLHKDLRGTIDTGTGYGLWWNAYEDMHRRLWMLQPYTDGGPYGGAASKPNKTGGSSVRPRPETHVWINRYIRWEYTQWLSWLDPERNHSTRAVG
eukprot:NODE_2862_length_1102_cov_32.140551_g2624_i0.p1 GENE.NODE_2862_length_1102_cov_32.140551_g2624_i0~~NODE_2862_length_1102_cov_32.140551_g2624_i0.p1  ORF type:complete len:185 (-),score=22.25 NODE_2862_length_1102_cov_32.140551_g2624_i0:159-713(-)